MERLKYRQFPFCNSQAQFSMKSFLIATVAVFACAIVSLPFYSTKQFKNVV